jgi:molybdopterin molybdotransferase
MPGYLKVVAEILMGAQSEFTLDPGQCALIHTGGMLPGASNAVIMVEYTQAVNADEIEILRPVADGENIIHPGEDVKTGEVIIPSQSGPPSGNWWIGCTRY